MSSGSCILRVLSLWIMANVLGCGAMPHVIHVSLAPEAMPSLSGDPMDDINWFAKHWPRVDDPQTQTEGDAEAIEFVRKLQSLKRGMPVVNAEIALGIKPVKVIRGERIDYVHDKQWEYRFYKKEFGQNFVIRSDKDQGQGWDRFLIFYIVAWNGRGGKWIASIHEPE